MNILIVDDHPVSVQFLRRQLEGQNHTVVEACDGIEALKVLAAKPVDAVVSDVLMPNMDGLQLCLEVRKSERHFAVPFLIYTDTYNSSSDLKLALAAGADGHVAKAAPVEALLAALESVRAGSAGRARSAAGLTVEETGVLKQYNVALVTLLKERNGELAAKVDSLNRAHEKIRQLNAELEGRVSERTAGLESAVKELEAFSYSVSHDLRAPLRGIDGFARALQEAQGARLDREGNRLLSVIRSEARSMGRLIDDLLAFSRASRQPIDASCVDMTELVEGVFQSLTETMPGCSVKLEVKPLPPTRGDRSMLRQVFANLLGNAIKFSGRRAAPVIEVGGWAEASSNSYFVKDNGAGFDQGHAHKLFGVFQRLHGQEEFEGTGVGLALVQRIVRRHGGRVWAEGKLDAGATFYFSLPNLAQAEDEHAI